ncbi:MAG: PAS domain S-box protein [Deltaproteobacteria bacterium]|nr:PAS domain S-box protein [Deltaproteobacteria bacterium]
MQLGRTRKMIPESQDDARRLAQVNRTIAEIGRIISSTLNIDDVYEQFAAEMKKIIPFDRISIGLIDPEQEIYRIAYTSGTDVPDRHQGTAMPLPAIIREIVGKRSGIVFHAETERDFVEVYPEILIPFRAGMRSIMAIPLISRDQVLGTLWCSSLRHGAYTDEDLRIAENVAAQIAGAIFNAQIHAQVKQAEEALRQSEEKYRVLFENAEEAIFVSQDNGIKFANPAMEALTGYPREELIKTACGQLFHPEDRGIVMERGRRRLRGEHLPSTHSFRLIRKNGEGIWIQVKTAVLAAWEGRPAILCFMRDISEQKRLETRLQLELDGRRKAAEELLINQRRLRDLASQLAIAEEQERRRIATYLHDNIGPSLAMAKWRLEALTDMVETGQIKDTVTGVLDLMRQTIEDLRGFTFEISLPILHELGIAAALEWLGENLLKPHGISIEIVTEHAEKSLNRDARILFFHAARELVLNIVKHAKATNARIEIRGRGDMLVVTVVDNGKGFDVHAWRADFSTSQGFGLFNVKERIESIGGSVEIQSSASKGTRVTLRVPLHKEA